MKCPQQSLHTREDSDILELELNCNRAHLSPSTTKHLIVKFKSSLSVPVGLQPHLSTLCTSMHCVCVQLASPTWYAYDSEAACLAITHLNTVFPCLPQHNLCLFA